MKQYESEKKMRGSAIGTILPWSGDQATIPKGWLACNGQVLEAMNFPVLASILGNTYGPTNGLNNRTYPNYISGDTFALPQLNTRLLADYEEDYVSVAALQAGQTYQSGAVGGMTITNGEVDEGRTAATYNFTVTSASGGTGCQVTIDVDAQGRAGVTKIVDAGGGYTAGDKITIDAASLPSGTDDLVLKVDWTLPSVPDVLTPTGAGTNKLIEGDGSGVSPGTSYNANSDINFVITDSSSLTGQIRNFSVNPPNYFKTFHSLPRKLSKDHMPPHTHGNPTVIGNQGTGYRYVLDDGGFFESFQCPKVETNVEGNFKQKTLVASEPPSSGSPDTVGGNQGTALVTRFVANQTIVDMSRPRLNPNNTGGVGTYNPQPVWTGPMPRPLGATYSNVNSVYNCNERESNLNSKNWYGYQGEGDNIATNLFNPADEGTSKTFPVALNHADEYHANQQSHTHYSFQLTMNAGFLKPPTIVAVNDIAIDSTLSGQPTAVAPQNLPSALNINVDVKTPAISMMYLIRAY